MRVIAVGKQESMADKAANMSAEEWNEKVLLGRFLGTITVLSWDLLATTTSVSDCCIESQVALSSAYILIAFEYRKPSPTGTVDIAFPEPLAYPTVQLEVRERNIVCILQLAEARAMIKWGNTRKNWRLWRKLRCPSWERTRK